MIRNVRLNNVEILECWKHYLSRLLQQSLLCKYMFASLLQLGSNHMFQRQNIFRFSICPIPVNTVYQERPEGISSNLAHTPTWTQGWTCLNLVVKDQSHWPQGFYISRTPWGKFLDFGQNVLHILSFRWLSSHHVLNRPSKRLCINSLWMKTTCFSLESYVNIHYMSGQTSTLLNSEHQPHTLCASAVLAVLLKDNDGLLSGCAEKQTKKNDGNCYMKNLQRREEEEEPKILSEELSSFEDIFIQIFVWINISCHGDCRRGHQ